MTGCLWSLDQNWRTPAPVEPVKPVAEPVFYNEADMLNFEEKQSSLVDAAVSLHSQLNRQPSPPPVAAEVHHMTAASHALPSHENGCAEAHLSDNSIPSAVAMRFSDESVQSRKPKQLHIVRKSANYHSARLHFLDHWCFPLLFRFAYLTMTIQFFWPSCLFVRVFLRGDSLNGVVN